MFTGYGYLVLISPLLVSLAASTKNNCICCRVFFSLQQLCRNQGLVLKLPGRKPSVSSVKMLITIKSAKMKYCRVWQNFSDLLDKVWKILDCLLFPWQIIYLIWCGLTPPRYLDSPASFQNPRFLDQFQFHHSRCFLICWRILDCFSANFFSSWPIFFFVKFNGCYVLKVPYVRYYFSVCL